MRAYQILTSIPFNLASATLSAVAKLSSAIEGISANLYLKSVRIAIVWIAIEKDVLRQAEGSYLLSAGFSLFPFEVFAVQLLMISTSFGLRWMGTPNAFAIPGCKQFSTVSWSHVKWLSSFLPSKVKSSWVGPTPPDVKTRSNLSLNRETSSAMISTPSEITDTRHKSTPSCLICPAKKNVLTSWVWPKKRGCFDHIFSQNRHLELTYIITRDPWTATPALIKVNI